MSPSALYIVAVCLWMTHLGRADVIGRGEMSDSVKSRFWKVMEEFLILYKNTPEEEGADLQKLDIQMDATVAMDTEHSYHPFMQVIYDEIEKKRHQKWTEMETQVGATIRGIEPFKVSTDQAQDRPNSVLDFTIGVITSLQDMHHIELILSTSGEAEGDEAPEYVVSMLLPKPQMGPKKVHLGAYQQGSYVSLDLTTAIRNWWNVEYFRVRKLLRLRISRKDGAEVKVDRPLLLFYYTAGSEEKNLDTQLRETVKGHLRRARSVYTQPRPCKGSCVYGERKNYAGDKQRWSHHHKPCTLHPYTISLQKLKWDHLFIAPKEFNMNYCGGSCSGPIADTLYNATNHAITRAQLLTSLPEESVKEIPPPYCVPTQLKRIDALYQDANGQYVLKPWENIVAEQCGCS